jgi:HPt (histidine-containing phosphotransfer) domain-containing protein
MAKTGGTGGLDDGLDLDLLNANLSGDVAAVVEVLDLFCDQAKDQLARMEVGLAPTAWKRLLHSLRGAALTVGAVALAEQCKAAEALAESEPDDRLEALTSVQSAAEAALSAAADYSARNRSQTENS